MNKGLDTSWTPPTTVVYTSYQNALNRRSGIEIQTLIKPDYLNAIPIPSKLMTSETTSVDVTGSINAFVTCIPQYNTNEWDSGIRLQGTTTCLSTNNIVIGSF